jgi:hypothetical protein
MIYHSNMTRAALYENYSDTIWEAIHTNTSWDDILLLIGVGTKRGLTQWAWKRGWGIKVLGINKIKYERK